MSQTTVSIRMDKDIKKRFDTFCADVGMNATVAINIFARAVLRENRIPFEIAGSDDPFFNPKNQAHLQEAIEQMNAGMGKVHDLIEVEDD